MYRKVPGKDLLQAPVVIGPVNQLPDAPRNVLAQGVMLRGNQRRIGRHVPQQVKETVRHLRSGQQRPFSPPLRHFIQRHRQ